jgi:hypothetical protein
VLSSDVKENFMTAARASAPSRSRLARFTRIYPLLQGYALLPWLLPMVALLLMDTGVVRGGWTLLLFGVSLVLAWLEQRAVSRWYERTYGLVRQQGVKFGSFAFLGMFLVGFWLLPPLLVRYAGVPDGLFSWRGVLHWPWLWVGVTLVGAAFALRPHLSFVAVFGALLATTASLPLGEWLGTSDGRHLFYGFAAGRTLGFALILGYAFSAHGALVRELRVIQGQLGAPAASSTIPNAGIGANEAGDDA